MCDVQAAMRDRWLNSGYHGEELRPHVQPSREIDNDRVGKQQERKLKFRAVSLLSVVCLMVNINLIPGLLRRWRK